MTSSLPVSKRALLTALSAFVALVIAGCGGGGSSTTHSTTTSSSSAPASSSSSATSSSSSAAKTKNGIPQGNGAGDNDLDNHGGPSDGDGNL
jgi:hypothetical protein